MAVVDTRSQYDGLAGIYLPIALAVFIVVLVLVVLFALRYRRRDDGRPASGPASAPKLEAAYVLALSGIAAFLVWTTFRTETKVDRLAAHPALTVAVTAAKWHWRFDYPDAGVSQLGIDRRPPTLVVPAGMPVRFRLSSLDVIHAFWIPERRFKRASE